MGCGPSKEVRGGVADVYRPLPSSFAVFDINAIEEPWLKPQQLHAPPPLQDDEKPTRNARAAAAVLEKLDAAAADAPRSWEEVSKALETHLKSPAVAGETKSTAAKIKSLSFHTVEELEPKTKKTDDEEKPLQKLMRKTEWETRGESGLRPVRENMFVVRDRERREREGKKGGEERWDPLREFPERCPAGGGRGVVVYTTSLHGVRRTYEDCVRVRAIMEQLGVVFDERDVALDAGIRTQLRQLLGPQEVGPPRIFVNGRYLGGAAEVVGMNESGKLGRMMRWARVERVAEEGRHTCEACGGVRWLPCLDCGGSCKVRAAAEADGWERCGKCNENGLVRCPLCFTV